MILASKIVGNPSLVDSIGDKYAIIYDTAIGYKFDNLNKAINILAQKGWRCVSIAFLPQEKVSSAMYTLLERL